MGFVADPLKQVYGTWTFGYLDGLQAWMVQNYAPTTPEGTTYFAAMGVQPSQALKNQINILIQALKDAGVYAKLDWLSLLGHMHTAQAAGINMINPAQFLTPVAAPAFTAGAAGGYVGNGTTQYLNSSWNPTTAPAPKFTQNSAHIGVWCGAPDVNSGGIDIGTVNSRINPNNTGVAGTTRANSVASNAPLNGGTSVGHMVAGRLDAANHFGMKNGANYATSASASTVLDNSNIFIMAYGNAGVPTSFSTRKIVAAHWGAGLTQAEVTAMYNALNTFFNSPYS